VERGKEGDMEALHFLYVRYWADVLRFVRSLVGDHHEAEDITQDVFAKLMAAIHEYEQREAPFAAWLLRVARNATRDHLGVQGVTPIEEARLRHRATRS
jgi:RNA polymerase sigma-70 factor, ECF subfamily